MPKYTVLAEVHQYFEIEADNPCLLHTSDAADDQSTV
jgi:hypothetical protein